MSGKSKKVEPAGGVYFPLPDLSRKIERNSAFARSIVFVLCLWIRYSISLVDGERNFIQVSSRSSAEALIGDTVN